MPLSLSEIRDLNKVTLYVTCCTDPAVDSSSAGSGSVWSVGMYSSGGFPLHGHIDVDNSLWDSKNMSNNKWAGVLGGLIDNGLGLGFGMVPQIDYVHKMTLKKSDSLKFTVQCYLCLENGVEDDFLRPLSQLFFLTYPVRSVGGSAYVDKLMGALGALVQKGLASVDAEAWYMKVLNNIFGSDVGASLQSWGSDFVSAVKNGSATRWFRESFGEVYGLHCPPTFRSLLQGEVGVGIAEFFGGDWGRTVDYGGNTVRYIDCGGSGLSVCYGGSIVSNCVITDLDVKIPKLYYHGGYPGVIELGITFATLRVGSANLYRDLIYGRVGI